MSQRIIKMVIRMPEELHQQLRQQAPERHQSMNAIVVQGISREVNRHHVGLPEGLEASIQLVAQRLAEQTLALVAKDLAQEAAHEPRT